MSAVSLVLEVAVAGAKGQQETVQASDKIRLELFKTFHKDGILLGWNLGRGGVKAYDGVLQFQTGISKDLFG